MYENVNYYIPTKYDILINFTPDIKYSDCSTEATGRINVNAVLLSNMPENKKVPFRKFNQDNNFMEFSGTIAK